MARIRSIKPDFWKSEAIAALSIRQRLTFIGLWTYVDDNGVGLDNEKLVAAELFALEDDPRETLANVREDLARLSEAGRIRRYTVGDKRYLEIVNWREHQKIDKPGKPRYPDSAHPDAVPLSSENAKASASHNADSRESREDVAKDSRLEQGTGSREQGTEEQGFSAPSPLRSEGPGADAPRATLFVVEDEHVVAKPVTAQTLVGEWLDECSNRPPKAVIGQMAKQIRNLLDEGIDPDHVRGGIERWMTRDVHPSVLPSLVNEVMNGKPKPAATTAPANSTQAMLARQMERALALDAQEAASC